MARALILCHRPTTQRFIHGLMVKKRRGGFLILLGEKRRMRKKKEAQSQAAAHAASTPIPPPPPQYATTVAPKRGRGQQQTQQQREEVPAPSAAPIPPLQRPLSSFAQRAQLTATSTTSSRSVDNTPLHTLSEAPTEMSSSPSLRAQTA